MFWFSTFKEIIDIHVYSWPKVWTLHFVLIKYSFFYDSRYRRSTIVLIIYWCCACHCFRHKKDIIVYNFAEIFSILANYRRFPINSAEFRLLAITIIIILMSNVCDCRYKLWADESSQLFGGLDMLAVQVIQAKDGQEYIIDVSNLIAPSTIV